MRVVERNASDGVNYGKPFVSKFDSKKTYAQVGQCRSYQVDLRGSIRSLPYRIESVIYNIKSMLDKNRIDEIEIESMLDKIESMLDGIKSN